MLSFTVPISFLSYVTLHGDDTHYNVYLFDCAYVSSFADVGEPVCEVQV